MVKVSVKWGTQTFTDLDLDAKEPLDTFQAQLFALTNVPLERQKIFYKGKWLKESSLLAAVPEGAQLSLLGSADVLAKAPERKIVFEEDLSDRQKAQLLPSASSAGLVNLGNTCYMNSTLQCLRAVTPLKESLRRYATSGTAVPGADGTDPHHTITHALGSLYTDMDNTTTPVTPARFCLSFRRLYPQFDETDDHGRHKQQDADECLQQIMGSLSGKLKGSFISGVGEEKKVDNAIDDVFGGDMAETLSCVEVPEEAVKHTRTPFRKLRCFIDEKINFMSEGIQRAFEEPIEKRSETLGRTAQYTKKSAITRLPPFLIVQFMRFFWRKDTGKKAKILRPVSFPDKLDIMPFTDNRLKATLGAIRRVLNEEKEKELGIAAKAKVKAAPLLPSMAAGAPKREKEPKREAAGATGASAGAGAATATATPAAGAGATPGAGATAEPAPVERKETIEMVERVPTDTSGFFELIGIVTHVGRMADSGHYIGWAKKDADNWLRFDDSVVTTVPADEVKALGASGADQHMVYVSIYKRVDDLRGRATPLDLPTTVPLILPPPVAASSSSSSSSSSAPAKTAS